MDYFIDESGQTGDVARLNTLSDFNDQPIFCLAAVGVVSEFSLEQEINRLREKHGVRLDELKSSARRERPELTYDVVKLICTERYPFFLEIMDKKFFLATHITSCQLLPPIRGLAADPPRLISFRISSQIISSNDCLTLSLRSSSRRAYPPLTKLSAPSFLR